MADGFGDGADERQLLEAEELMRQRRFGDAARRYQDLHRRQPTDLWTALGFVSALECAGELDAAERVLETMTTQHTGSAPLHRFRQLFFTRREDFRRAAHSQAQLRAGSVDGAEADHLADLYFNQGRYHEALAELERQLNAGIEDLTARAAALARSGACMRQSGDPEGARERLLMALALLPGDPWTLSELAEAERALGLVEQARKHYSQSIERNPEDHWTRGHLAQLESEDGNQERSIALYEQVLEREPKAVWARVELAQVLTEKDPVRATELCRSALAQDPDYPWAHAQLGAIARKRNLPEEAYACYLRAARAAANAPWIQHELCDIARHLGRLDAAEKHLDAARAIDPYDATTHGYYADLRRHQGRLKEALNHLQQAVQLDQGYLWAWRELAEVRALLGEHVAAEEAYREARELAPEDAVTDGLIAFLLKHRGERDRAEPWLERAVERQPDYLWAWRELIELHLAADRPLAAAHAADRALNHLPEAPMLMGLAAEARRRMGRTDEAIVLCDRALSRIPDTPQLHALRAELAVVGDDWATAVPAALRAAELDPAPEFQLLKAQVLAAAGRDAESLPVVERLCAQEKPAPPALELAAALAERRGDRSAAQALLDRAQAQTPEDLRLQIRRARLTVQAGDRSAAEPLLPLVESDQALPWGELALLLAQGGHPAAARRAAQRHAGSVPPIQAWMLVAEVEFHLGARDAAYQAAEAAVAADPANPAARLIAAVVSEQRGDTTTAAAHLDAALAAGPPADANLLRQAAQLRERLGRHADAEQAWRALAEQGDGPRAELAGYLYRCDRHDDADALAAPLLALPESPEQQRLLRDRALARARRDGAAAGLACLLEHESRLHIGGRLLAVQLALAADDLPAAHRHLAACQPQNDGERRAVSLMTARCALAEDGDALTPARAAHALGPRDGDVRLTLAEALVLARQPRQALEMLEEGGPCDALGAALACALALVLDGEPAALLRLSRHPPIESGLGRLLCAAWPLAHPEGARQAGTEDVSSLPVPHAYGEILARALVAAGRQDCAAALRIAAAHAAEEAGDAGQAARLRRAAVPSLIAAVGRRHALAFAWEHRDPLGILRCIFLP